MNKLLIAVAVSACVMNLAQALSPGAMFVLYDIDGNGVLDLGELTAIFNKFDVDNNREVPFDEFLHSWRLLGHGTDDQGYAFFQGLDANGDQVIDEANDRVGFGYFDRMPEDGLITSTEFISRFPQN